MNIIQKVFFERRRFYARKEINGSWQLDIGSSKYPIREDSLTLDIRKTTNPDICGSILFLPFRNHSFDYITFLEVIEHIPIGTQTKAIIECKKVLKSKGKLIVSMPNYSRIMKPIQDLVWFIREHTTEIEYHENKFTDTHVGKITPNQLVSTLRKHGFNIQNTKRIMLYDFLVIAQNET